MSVVDVRLTSDEADWPWNRASRDTQERQSAYPKRVSQQQRPHLRMRLLRAICECGYQTQKAREGYHFHQWWFAVFHYDTGLLSDVCRQLPEDQVNLIQLSKVEASEFHGPFIQAVTAELTADYAARDNERLRPAVGDSFPCPNCCQSTLQIDIVNVTAYCKTDCGHEYPWLDSETRGCPLCNHRPHRFRINCDPDSTNRTISHCPCSSSMDSADHVDAFCPKCGELPVSYHRDDQSYCGMHHSPMESYRAPRNFLFIHSSSQFASDRFPNAKLWGDCEADDALSSTYCPTCEADHQAWLATHESG
jgi:deoxycytidylate deaminase